jgi:hypothetical protein
MAFILLGSEVSILALKTCALGNGVETSSEPDAKGMRGTSDSICKIRVEGLKIDDIYLFA